MPPKSGGIDFVDLVRLGYLLSKNNSCSSGSLNHAHSVLAHSPPKSRRTLHISILPQPGVVFKPRYDSNSFPRASNPRGHIIQLDHQPFRPISLTTNPRSDSKSPSTTRTSTRQVMHTMPTSHAQRYRRPISSRCSKPMPKTLRCKTPSTNSYLTRSRKKNFATC